MKRRLFPTLAATALTAALLAGCGDDEPAAVGDTEASDTAAVPSDSPTETEATEGTATTSAPPTSTATVPVYFVGDTPQGPRLFREFRKVETDNPLEAAADLLTSGDAADPDYRTLFPGGSFDAVTSEGGEIVVSVPDDGWRAPVDQTPAEAKLAVQQLVYTLQGVQQERLPVRVVGPSGQPEPSLFGVDASGGLTAAPQVQVLSLVNVTTPEEGATVSGTFTAEGVANSFEATVPWEIRDGAGEAVLDGFSTAGGWGDKLYPWTTKVDVSGLDAGEYTFVAMTDDPSGGEGGGPTEDTKTIVVE